MRYLFTGIMMMMTCLAVGQDLTGIWRGQFRSNNRMLQLMNIDDRYKFEVQLDQNGKAFKGVTYSYKTTEFYGKADARGTINPATKKVLLEELKIVDVRMRTGSDACVMTCFLQYYKNGSEEFLEGTYVSMNTSDSTDCGRGTVFLRRVEQSDFFKEPFLIAKEKKMQQDLARKKASPPEPVAKSATPSKPATPAPPGKKPPVPPQPPKPVEDRNIAGKSPTSDQQRDYHKPAEPTIIPPVLKNRENEVVKTINVTSREIIVSLYDNGTIDHDTVSVYLNKRMVVNRQMLSLAPITVHIELDDDNDYQELVMVAENLGEIPPNTSLMVVKAGNQQFEVRITSTEQKNAVVIFKYDPPR